MFPALEQVMRRCGVMPLAVLLAVSCSDGTQPPTVASVDVSAPTASVPVYRTLQLTATVKDRAGKTLARQQVNWASSNAPVATVSDSGLVTGVTAGTVVITASSQGRSGTLELEISPAAVDTVRLTPDTATLIQGRTGALTATLKDERGVTLTGRTVVWTSDSVNVATVADGVVTALNGGRTRITATVEGKGDTATITVRDTVVSVAIGPSASFTLQQGDSRSLEALVRNGTGGRVHGWPVAWTTSDSAVAVVSAQGLVRAIAAGTASISATVEGKSATALATVVDTVATVTVEPATATLGLGDTLTFKATLRNAAGEPLTGGTIVWIADVGEIVGVSLQGRATARGIGTTRVRAHTFRGKFGFATVTVTAGSGPVITTIVPEVLVPGSVLAIRGTGFSAVGAANEVTIGGHRAELVFAGNTQLSVTVPCLPSGVYPVVVTVAGKAAETVSAPLQVESRPTLGVGDAVVITDQRRVGCTELAATNVESRYVLAVFNPLVSTDEPVNYQFSGLASTAASLAAMESARAAPAARGPGFGRGFPAPQSSDPAQSAHDTAHHRLLEKNQAAYRRLWQRYGGDMQRAARVTPGATPAARVPPLTRKIRVSNIYAQDICNTYFEIDVRRVYYSGKLAIYEDDDTPLALKAAFNPAMAAYYRKIGDQFNADMEPIIRTNFGDILRRDALTDNDGVLSAVFTPVLNNQLKAVGGFVIGCDLFPNAPDNKASNFGEFFYAHLPTNAGSGYDSFTPDAWYRSIRSLFIHETKHVASLVARVANNSPAPEVSWLEEGTALHAEELWGRQALYGVAWKGNTGYGSAANPGSIYCDVWPTAVCNATNPRRPATALSRHFAGLYSFLGNSGELSPFGLSDSDDAGYFYAISWSLVRYAIDRYATTEASFLTGLTESTTTGAANLSGRAGVALEQLLGRWALALYADDRAGLGSSADVQIPTWHIPDIFAGLKADLPGTYTRATPLVTTPVSFGTIAPTNYLVLVGGGFDYFELSGMHSAAQVLRVAHVTGGAPAYALRIAILRVQ